VEYHYGWINFTVLAEQECRYSVSLTNSLFIMLGESKFYTLEVEDGAVTFLYRS
jgi:hypothetical protein